MENKEIKFSIIIPVYNAGKYLAECLDSLVAQSYANWEAICVDDGSTDGSGKILDDYASRDPRFHIIHKKNEGVSIARNTGSKQASGDWVGFLDADDVILPSWLRKSYEAIIDERPDFIRMNLRKWRGNHPYPRPDEKTTAQTVVDNMLWGWINIPMRGWVFVCFYMRELLKVSGVSFTPGMRIAEDTIFNLRLLPFINKIVEMDYPGYLYRMSFSSAVHTTRRAEYCICQCEGLRNCWTNQVGKFSRSDISLFRDSVTQSIVECIVAYIHFRTVENDSYRRIADEFCRCYESNMISMHSVPMKWRIPFYFVLKQKSLLPLVVVYEILDVPKKPLRWVKHRILHIA